jgi:hypothetical protein
VIESARGFGGSGGDDGATMKRFLCHEHVLVRFGGLYLLGLVFFLGAWHLGYYVLPEGALKASSIAAQAAGDEVSATLAGELTRILLINVIMGALIITFNLALRINNLPLGYLVPAVWFILYGLILGSNSFSIPMDERMGPSFNVIQRSGLYELAAYTLIAVATFNTSRFEIKRLFLTNPERTTEQRSFNRQQYVALAVALLLLFFSNVRESLMLFAIS